MYLKKAGIFKCPLWKFRNSIGNRYTPRISLIQLENFKPRSILSSQFYILITVLMAGNFAFLTVFFFFPFVFFSFLPMSVQVVAPSPIILQAYGYLQTLARDGVNSFFFPILHFGSLFAWELWFLSNSTRSALINSSSILPFF